MLRCLKRICTTGSSFPLRWSSSHTGGELWIEHEQAKNWLMCKKLPDDINPLAVFCNNEVNLQEVEVYGFDYDYTLASYKRGVEYLIHDIAREHLVNKFGYPKDVNNIVYDRDFAVRGLHYDVEKGLFLKVDSSNQIQLGSVHRGRERLDNKEVMNLYKRRQLPAAFLEPNKKLVQLVDIFSRPEMSLIAGLIDFFKLEDFKFEPESLYHDVAKCIGIAHATFHAETRANPKLYLHRDPELIPYLAMLQSAGKKIFLITNSPFETVDVGMSYKVGENWREYFDVIVVQAGKPHFFTNNSQPFRELNLETNTFLWDTVTELRKGRIYAGGKIDQFQALTGWMGAQVMYFGDHPYADLADATLLHGWHTAAVIRELEVELEMMNSEEFKWGVSWQQVLMALIDEHQHVVDTESQKVVSEWKSELKLLQTGLKSMFNPHFGSAFRTHHSPTFFSRKLFSYSDIYTSRVTNLQKYSLNHSFYPRRGVLPHEFKSWFV